MKNDWVTSKIQAIESTALNKFNHRPTAQSSTEKPTIYPSQRPTTSPSSGPITISPTAQPSTDKTTIYPSQRPTTSPSSGPITISPISRYPTSHPTTQRNTLMPTENPVRIGPSRRPATNTATHPSPNKWTKPGYSIKPASNTIEVATTTNPTVSISPTKGPLNTQTLATTKPTVSISPTKGSFNTNTLATTHPTVSISPAQRPIVIATAGPTGSISPVQATLSLTSNVSFKPQQPSPTSTPSTTKIATYKPTISFSAEEKTVYVPVKVCAIVEDQNNSSTMVKANDIINGTENELLHAVIMAISQVVNRNTEGGILITYQQRSSTAVPWNINGTVGSRRKLESLLYTGIAFVSEAPNNCIYANLPFRIVTSFQNSTTSVSSSIDDEDDDCSDDDDAGGTSNDDDWTDDDDEASGDDDDSSGGTGDDDDSSGGAGDDDDLSGGAGDDDDWYYDDAVSKVSSPLINSSARTDNTTETNELEQIVNSVIKKQIEDGEMLRLVQVIDPRINSIEYFQIQPADGLSTTTQSVKSFNHVLQYVGVGLFALTIALCSALFLTARQRKSHREHQNLL